MPDCPQCKTHIPTFDAMTKPLVCPQCHARLGFNAKGYNQITRPGLYIAFALMMNMYLTQEILKRLFMNVVILIVWFAFLLRLIHYIKWARLEVRE